MSTRRLVGFRTWGALCFLLVLLPMYLFLQQTESNLLLQRSPPNLPSRRLTQTEKASNFEKAVFYPLKSKHEFKDFLTGPGLATLYAKTNATASSEHNDVAVCEWAFRKNNHHLPHAMQQLYSCVSWWNYHSHQKPILISKYPRLSPFVEGFIKTLKEVFEVKIVFFRRSLPYVYFKIGAQPSYCVNSTDHLRTLREKTLEFYNVSRKEGGCSVPDKSGQRKHTPRITILNRGPGQGREWHMVEQVHKIILAEYNLPVSIEYFEGRSYDEQINVFANTDILLSPHGAQLTGLAFMPACGALLEIFPMGYLVPRYFGSLAASNALSYYFLYLGSNATVEADIWMKTRKSRAEARSQPITPNITVVMQTLRQMIQKWTICCREKAAAEVQAASALKNHTKDENETL